MGDDGLGTTVRLGVVGREAPAAESVPLFTVLSFQGRVQPLARWWPMVKDVCDGIGRRGGSFLTLDHAVLVEALCLHRLPVVWLGNHAVAEAVERAGAAVFTRLTVAHGAESCHAHRLLPRDAGRRPGASFAV